MNDRGTLRAARAAPAQPARGGRIGVLLVNLGTPDATDAGIGAPLSQGVPQRRAGDREPGPGLEVRPQRHHPDHAAAPQRRGLSRRSGIASGTNRRSRPSPARRPTKLARTLDAARSDDHGRLGDALRQSVDRSRGSRRWPRPAASASCCCRSIRNMPRRPPPRSATRRLRALMRMRDQPALRVAPPYYDDPVYIEALASSIERGAAAAAVSSPIVILASFHGIPKAYVDDGDPYHVHCVRDGAAPARPAQARRKQIDADLPVAFRPRRMAAALHRPDGQGAGPARREEPRGGHARASPPTAWRRWRRSRSRTPISSSAHGGENFAAIPCLNDSAAGMPVIWHLALRELQGWI